MTRFVELPTSRDSSVWVNPDHIVSVEAGRDLDIALGGDPDCAHSRVERRSTTFGVRRFCADCDRFMS